MRFEGKTAVVTGGANGIGAGCVRRFAKEGANVMIADIDETTAQALIADLKDAPGTVQFTHTDITKRDAVQALFDATIEAFDAVDILVNNAAYVHKDGAIANFLEYSNDAWEITLGINLSGMFYCSQIAARLMAKRGEGGAIINMSSGGGSRAHRKMFGYDTTKGGIEAATRSMALDLAPLFIRVNAVAPGSIKVDNQTIVSGNPIPPSETIPIPRQGTPTDIAGAVAFLASDDATYITGTCLYVDGGMNAQLRTPSVDYDYDYSNFT